MKTLTYSNLRFWTKDWSKSVLIEEDDDFSCNFRKWKHQIRKLLGKGFRWERSLEIGIPDYFIDTKNGLIKY